MEVARYLEMCNVLVHFLLQCDYVYIYIYIYVYIYIYIHNVMYTAVGFIYPIIHLSHLHVRFN